MNGRGKWQGMWTIVRFNWPFYLVAFTGLVIGAAVSLTWWGTWVGILGGLACLGLLYFLVGSLGVSHLIYDRSDLYRFGWLARALGENRVRRGVFCHSGFDESSALIRERISPGKWRVLDHYDATLMDEPSIRRARRAFPPDDETVAAKYDRWPLEDASADVVFGILAIHELREHPQRSAWFGEASRCLDVGGVIVVVEHLRDFPNFLAFGPGFLHFHSRATWRKSWQKAGLVLADEFRITPWVKCFVLKNDD